jgi:hypothetical protein
MQLQQLVGQLILKSSNISFTPLASGCALIRLQQVRQTAEYLIIIAMTGDC